MAVPVLLGLPWLAGVLGSVFISIVTFMATYIGKRVALTIAAVAALTLLTTGIIATINGLFSGLIGTFPVAANVGLVLPDGFAVSIGVYVAGRIALWVYHMNWLIVRMRLL